MPLAEALATTLLALSRGLSAWVLARPHRKPYAGGLVALLLFVPGLALAGARPWAEFNPQSLALLFAALMLVPTWIIARGFGRVDLMAIVIHAGLGIKGGTLKGYENEIVSSLVLVSIATVSVWRLYALLVVGSAPLWLGTGLLVALNPLIRNAIGRLWHPTARADLSAALHRPGPLRRPETLPDIVVVYLEGLDRRFLDRATYGETAARLAALEAEGLSFTGVRQIAGTGWSLAGMVASLAGVPVLPNGMRGHNKLGGIARFMPGLVALGDVLGQHGYAMEYVVGADPRFAVIDVFYRTHGIEVIGRDEQIAMHPASDVAAARIDRVLDDQMTFDSARLRHAALAGAPAPLALIVETIGPHGRTGYLSRRATKDGQGCKSRDALAVVASLVDETLRFLADVRATHARLRSARPLRIIVLSDHLSHNVNLAPPPPELAGRNTVIFLGEGAGTNPRDGAMVDVYPTILEWLGFAGPGARGNLGRSLLSSEPTLLEVHGLRALDALLTSDGELAGRLWSESDTYRAG